MKKNIIFIMLLIGSINCILECQEKRQYMSKYLPDDSVIKQTCGACVSRFSFFKSDVERGCDAIEEILVKRDSENADVKIPYNWFAEITMMGNSEELKDAIRKVLHDKDDDIKWQEYDRVVKAADKIIKVRKNRLQERKKQEALQEEQNKKNF